MSKPIDWYARRYTERFGFALVPIKPAQKLPVMSHWGNNTISDPDAAQKYYQQHADQNMGLELGLSRMCSLDIDDAEAFAHICECYGIDLPSLIKTTPTILGRGQRLMFRVPAGVDLPYRKLNWKRQDDPSKSFTVFELRSSCDGKQRFDILPPSMHPETGKPYAWITQPADDWPEPPRWLMAMWQDFDRFKGQMQSMCPWAAPEPAPARVSRETRNHGQGDSVIDAYNAAHDLCSELERYGYKRIGSRWLSPHSGTGLPGVLVFPDGDSAWIHHASDPLCSEDSGKPVNAFDLFCYYDHGNDASKAAKAAAKMLGMVSEPRARLIEQVKQSAAPAPQAEPGHAVTEVRDVLPAQINRGDYNLAEPLKFTTEKGKPIKHIDNLREICARMGVTIRYNVIAKEEELLIPGESFTLDNGANASLAWLKSECTLFDMPTDSLDGMVTYIADKNLYNPVAEWIGSKPWDGVSRLADFYATVKGAHDDDQDRRTLKETLLRKWCVSAVAAALSPNGISAAGVLTFQGAQYLGKTKWFKSLAPSDMNLIKDGMILRPDDKDSVKQCVSFWLVELGELDATFRKSDIAALKSFLTNDRDVLRRAYARKESTYARRTVFFASVNPKEFLHDPTGNRRYWTIEATELDHSHSIDMQQFWAEIEHVWRAGESYYLTHDEVTALNGMNEEYTAVDPVEERIMGGLQWDAARTLWRWITATDLLLEVGVDRPTRGDAASCASILRKHNWNQGRRSNGKNLLLAPPSMKVGF